MKPQQELRMELLWSLEVYRRMVKQPSQVFLVKGQREEVRKRVEEYLQYLPSKLL
jgi:hypothetical protein